VGETVWQTQQGDLGTGVIHAPICRTLTSAANPAKAQELAAKSESTGVYFERSKAPLFGTPAI
jgi:hypothetical protein